MILQNLDSFTATPRLRSMNRTIDWCTGLSRESLKLEVSDGKLKVLKVARKDASAAEGCKDVAEEQLLGAWDLPDDAVTDGIHAKLEDNELFISVLRVPKASKACT